MEYVFYPDGSSYQHFLSVPADGVKTVGWLGSENEFTRGAVPKEFIDKLLLILCTRTETFDAHACVLRGIEPCGLCHRTIECKCAREGKPGMFLGMSELWIPTDHGRLFAAPSLVLHYIAEHQYRPPDDFIEAVNAVDFWPSLTPRVNLSVCGPVADRARIDSGGIRFRALTHPRYLRSASSGGAGIAATAVHMDVYGVSARCSLFPFSPHHFFNTVSPVPM